jgi:hypothetical protein
MRFIPASEFSIIEGRPIERLEDGSLRSPTGAAGWILYGPYLALEGGVYRVTARTRASGDGQRPLYWDISAAGRVYATGEFSDGATIVVKLPDTRALEFRFMTDGAEFIHEGVELEPLLLDRAVVSAAQVVDLGARLTSATATAEAMFSLAERLDALDEREAAERVRRAFIAGNGRVIAKVRALLQELHGPGRPCLSPENEVSLGRAELYPAVKALPLAIIDLPPHAEPFRQSSWNELLSRGYHPDFIQANRLHRVPGVPRRPWQKDPPPGSESAPRTPMFEALANVDLSFQTALARGEGMSAYCPVSGRLLKSTHGFCEHIVGQPQIFYRFEGAEVFYVCTGGFIGGRMFLYMPRTGTIAAIEEPLLRWYPYAELVQAFNVSMLEHRHAVVRYLAEPVRYAAVYGLPNIGHFFWNDLPGLHYAVEAGLAADLAQIVKVPTLFMEHEPLFPELAQTPTVRLDDAHAVFGHFVSGGMTPVRFTDGVINDGYFARLRRAVAAGATPNGWPPPDAPRPLLWLNVRANNKVWVDQAAGYANILNAVYEEYGAAAALLQGMPDCADLAAEIRRLTRPEIPLYDGLDMTIEDKLNFAGEVDAYICVVGAGLVLTTWLADRPGVVHAEHGHMDQLAFWSYPRPNAPAPLAPPKSLIRELGTGWYCNYEVDWRLLLELLRPLLDARFERKSAPPTAPS